MSNKKGQVSTFRVFRERSTSGSRNNPSEATIVAHEAVSREIFDIEQQDATLIVTPLVDLRELDFQRIETGASEILVRLNGTGIKNVVMDFHKTDYYGSTALGFFVKLWKRVRSRSGRMAFCNLSDHESEILQITTLDHLWPICSSRSEALEAVKK
jgi:anti-anti-sigma factor